MFTKNELETILYSLEGYIQGNDDDKLCDELEDICNKIVEELEPPKVTITPQELEGDISTVTDDDYADKVDTLGWCIRSIDYTSNLLHPLTSYL